MLLFGGKRKGGVTIQAAQFIYLAGFSTRKVSERVR